MKTIKIEGDRAYVNITLNELIAIRNSIIQVLSQIEPWELKIRTTFHAKEIEDILGTVEQLIEEIQHNRKQK